MAFLKDFKAFAAKGNVIDLAIGVVIGAAFGKIVTALVADIIMPFVSMLTGGINFTDKFYVLKQGTEAPGPYPTLEAAQAAGANVLAYGHFFQSVVDFLIIAMSIFVVLRYLFHYLKKKEVEEAPPPPPMSTTDALLTEIRDSLKEKE